MCSIGLHISIAQSILDKRITLSIENMSVEQALQLIANETSYALNYLYSDLPQGRVVSEDYVNARLGDVIRDVWGKEPLHFRVQGTSIELQSEAFQSKPKIKGMIEGRITGQDGLAIPGAVIRIAGTTKGAVTDDQGYFKINGIAGERYELEISSIGIETLVRTITIPEEGMVKVDFQLNTATDELEELVIYGESIKEQLERTAQAITVVETKVAQVQTADLGEVMARTEGVSVQRSGGLGSDTRFSLNGLTNDQIRFFLDGIPLNNMGFVNGLANVPVNLVSRAEVYKGVVPIRFGADALGGAVNLVSPADFEGTTGSASYQLGSFGTHRLAGSIQHRPSNSQFFINGSGFYDYADNDYKINVQIPNERGRLTAEEVRRFHDAYNAYGLNTAFGFRSLSWADEISLRAFWSDTDRDIQHNNIMTIPYGEVTQGFTTVGGLLRWNKQLNSKLDLDLAAGLSNVRTFFLDTSSFVFNWFGEQARGLNGNVTVRPSPGELGDASDIEFTDEAYYARFTAGYQLTEQHRLQLSSAPTYTNRNGQNRLLALDELDPLDAPSDVTALVNGLELSGQTKDDKLEYLLFFKTYLQNVNAVQLIVDEFESRDRSTRETGYGAGITYRLNHRWSFKASYEWATRLPNVNEIFGNGGLIQSNVDLLPERSHNGNLSFVYDHRSSKSDWRVTVNSFLRNAEELIVLLGSGQVFTFQNVFNASSRGAEVSGNWTSANNRFSIDANGTYQDFINQADEGGFSGFKGDRIPNRPYLFANSNLKYSFSNLIKAQDELSFFMVTRYVHEFFRGWESVGRPDFKQTVPTQWSHNIGLTYRFQWANAINALTFESQNFTDARVFDFFGVQRPGRAFYFKISMQL
ncbi:MAG: carboxypeptidase-like regulatory domain-containing protein [Bacteroidota bacterium]